MTNAIFEATYADFKLVKTRSTAQFIFEVPQEKANAILQMIGIPSQDTSEWFAIAKLNKTENGGVVPTSPAVPESELVSSPATYYERARKICGIPEFQEFAWLSTNENEYKELTSIRSYDIASNYIKRVCGVRSRSEIDGNKDAMYAYDLIMNSFNHWNKYERGRAA